MYLSIVIILTAFVLRSTRIYYFDYTVNARPNACTLRVAVDRAFRGEGRNYGIWEPSRGRDDTDERQISHQRTCLLLPSASTLRRTPWTGSCAPEPAGVIIHDTRALGLSLQSGSTRANCRDVEDRTLVQPTQSQHLPLR